MRLTKLNARNCRGILDGPPLRIGDGGALVFGDNGTGKSSYVDALERVLTGACGSLDTGDQGISWSKQGKHVKATGPVEIELTVSDGQSDCIVSLDGVAQTGTKEVTRWLDAARQQSFLLRRRTMLRYIDSKPLDRYKAVSEFLDLAEFIEFEQRLKRVVEAATDGVRAAQTSANNAESRLRTQLHLSPGAAVTENGCVAAVNTALNAADLAPIANAIDADQRLKDVASSLLSFGDSDLFRKRHALLEAASALDDGGILASALISCANAEKALLEAASDVIGHFYPHVLTQALDWIEEDSLDACPVCESAIDAAALRERIAARLRDNEAYSEARRIVDSERAAYRQTLGEYAEQIQKLQRKWIESDEVRGVPPELKSLAESVTRIAAMPVGSSTEVEAASHAVSALNLAEVRRLLLEQVRQTSSTSGKDKFDALVGAQAFLTSFTLNSSVLASARADYARLSGALNQATLLYDMAVAARKKTVQEIMNSAADIANGYYTRIHPGERIGAPRLTVTERGSGSLTLDSDFHGHRGDPRGHYSEGHVDSLGLCVYLAIRRLHHRQRPEFALLVLDDVLHSVDGNHRLQTARLILEEFNDHQLVITTHDALWFENVKAAAAQYGNGKAFVPHRIADWSIDTGPVLGDHLSDYEWLCSTAASQAKPADRVIKAGRVLEQLLQQLCDTLTIAVPFRIRGDYTIDPLWVAFYSKARKQKGFAVKGETLLERIQALRAMRNWVGAHWNEWAQSLTGRESNDFVTAVLELRRLTYCDDCGAVIRRVPELDGVWSCRKEHLRYNSSAAQVTNVSTPAQ